MRVQRPYKVAQFGCLKAPSELNLPHITEQGLTLGLEGAGCEVDSYDEVDATAWETVTRDIRKYDFILWTYNAGRREPHPPKEAWQKLFAAARWRKVPVVGYHPDGWWGCKREPMLQSYPFQNVDVLCTPDGGNQDRFESIGINHYWMPSAVSPAECVLGKKIEGVPPLAFVGTTRGYHEGWPHRNALIQFLRRTTICEFYPGPRRPKIAGDQLSNLYASAKIAVGDSGNPSGRGYIWSNRIPVTLGRGGCLIHPYVDGLDEHFDIGTEIECWEPWDWKGLTYLIDSLLKDPDRRESLALAGRARVLKDHTYTSRMNTLIDLLRKEHGLR